jgi:transposase
LVIDEVQHALTTEEGTNALFSLKAARDSLKTDPGRYGMQLVVTGSSRDKLATIGQWARAGVLWRRHDAISRPWQKLRLMVGRPLQSQSGH